MTSCFHSSLKICVYLPNNRQLCYENVDPGLQLTDYNCTKETAENSHHEQIADLNKTLLHLSTLRCHGNGEAGPKNEQMAREIDGYNSN